MPRTQQHVQVQGRAVKLTNLHKVYWPEDGYTKGDLVDYYLQVAPYLLPHLKDRPLHLTRYPDGIHGKWFYQKDALPGTPPWMRTFPYPAEDRVIDYILADEPAALAYIANLGAIEIHPWTSRIHTPEESDFALIDLDPAEGATWEDVRAVALLARRVLDAFGLASFPKFSGATGIHVYVPLAAGHSYQEAADFVHALGRLLLRAYPEKVTLERVVKNRAGKVYVDFLQNRRSQTLTAVYGVRPHRGAPVSYPLTWPEVEANAVPRLSIRDLPGRLRRMGDLFAGTLYIRQEVRRATSELAAL